MNLPEEKDHLATLALHKSRTQADYYCVHDKVNGADLSRRAVKKFVSYIQKRFIGKRSLVIG